MKQRGYLMTCSRCGRQEFVSRDEDDLGGWMGLTLQRNKEEPLDICPACAKLFDTMAEIFVSSFANGVLCYTTDGDPVIFDPDALAYRDVREPHKPETEKTDEEETHDKYVISGVTYLTDQDALEGVTPDFLNKKFNIKKDEDDE